MFAISFFFLVYNYFAFEEEPLVGGTPWTNMGGFTIVGNSTHSSSALIFFPLDCSVFCFGEKRSKQTKTNQKRN